MRTRSGLACSLIAVLALFGCSSAAPATKGGPQPTPPITTPAPAPTPSAFTIGGSVSGLTGAGLVLEDNGGDDVAITKAGTFAFATSVQSGQPYSVSIRQQPTGQTCALSAASGSVGTGSITSILVNCSTNTYAIGGSISGLAGTVLIQDSGGDNLTLNANGTFAFAMPVKSGDAYSVTVKTQPSSPTQVCTVTNDSGTIAAAIVTNIQIACVTSSFTVGGNASGLTGAGLLLNDNGGDALAVAASGGFVFATPVKSGVAYAVTIAQQPVGQTCVLSAASGNVGSGNVTSVLLNCTENSYAVGGAISGLIGSVTLQNNGGDDLVLNANANFAFATPVVNGTPYDVQVTVQPSNPNQVCTVSNGAGNIAGADVGNIQIACVTTTYSVVAHVSGVVGAGLSLQDNGGDDLAIPADGDATFATAIADGQPFAVTVSAPPTGPNQTCIVTNGAGNIAGANADVTLVCTTNAYSVNVTVQGLLGAGLVLENEAGDDLAVAADGAYSFATKIADGQPYAVTVLTQPSNPNQVCAVQNGSGNVAGGDVGGIMITCN